jgi:hypothetical protein
VSAASVWLPALGDGKVGGLTPNNFSKTVTLRSLNQAVLGSLTQIGAGGSSGTLAAAGGIVPNYGNNLIGQGTVNSSNSLSTATIINGNVQGTGSGLTLTGYVSGPGTFSGPVTFVPLKRGCALVRIMSGS